MVHGVEVLADEVEVDVSCQGFAVDEFDGQSLVESALKLLHFVSELLPEVFEVQLLNVGQLVLVVDGPWEALALPVRKQLPYLGPDLVLGVLLVVADRHQSFLQVLAK